MRCESGMGTERLIPYPGSIGGTLALSCTLDAMARGTGVTDASNNHVWACGAVYNAANQMTSAALPAGQETNVYNNLFQLKQRIMLHSGVTSLNLTA
jgi:hypothetical protein